MLGNPNPGFKKALFSYEGALVNTSDAWTDLKMAPADAQAEFCTVPYSYMFQYGYGNADFEFRTVQGFYDLNGSWFTLQENDAVVVTADTVHSDASPAKKVECGTVFAKTQIKTSGAVSAAKIVIFGRAVS
jgi:hypothetical protein